MSLINVVETVVSVALVLFAFFAIIGKTMIKSVMFLSGLSMIAVVGFVLMKAPDVAITEAVIGSGITTAIFVFVLLSFRKGGVE